MSGTEHTTAVDERTTAVGRFGTVAEVASFVAYVANDEAAHLNGASLDIDGGYSA